MQKNNGTLQQILHTHPYTAQTPHTRRVLEQLKQCRTPALGYHLYRCKQETCATVKYQYHSCRNRHCPQCGALQKKQWVEDRQRELLPLPYYHVVFTLPHQLNAITLGNRSVLFNLLFKAAADTLLQFAKDEQYLGARPGILAVLHTWGQQLSFHPHVHCVVSGGGIIKRPQPDGTSKICWKQLKRKDNRFLFPVKAMSIVYRAIFLKELKRLIENKTVVLTDLQQPSYKALLQQLGQQPWVVYAKKPFGGPQQVVSYLAAYTHKVAVTNQRLLDCDVQGQVRFRYKDYRSGGVQKHMQLPATEFLRRFEQHILPKGFTKIRTYGYLANRGRQGNLQAITRAFNIPAHPPAVKIPWQLRLYEMYGIRHDQCPCCNKISMVLVRKTLGPAGPDTS